MFREIELPFVPSVVVILLTSMLLIAMAVSLIDDISDARDAPPMTTVVLLNQ